LPANQALRETARAGTLPFTGLSLLFALTVGLVLTAAGFALRGRAR
jgi:hypothetical protein